MNLVLMVDLTLIIVLKSINPIFALNQAVSIMIAIDLTKSQINLGSFVIIPKKVLVYSKLQ